MYGARHGACGARPYPPSSKNFNSNRRISRMSRFSCDMASKTSRHSLAEPGRDPIGRKSRSYVIRITPEGQHGSYTWVSGMAVQLSNRHNAVADGAGFALASLYERTGCREGL